MPKKPASTPNNIQKQLDVAQKAVANMSDEKLKEVAFRVILERLLASGDLSSDNPVEPAPDERAGKKHEKAKQPGGPKGRIQALIEDDYFSQQRTIGEVRGALEARGWFHKLDEINPTLLRLVQGKKLRRIKVPDKKGGKLTWRYSNW